MARANERWISMGPLKGQNSTENPLVLGPGWASRTENIVLNPESAVAMKRRGSTVIPNVPQGNYLMVRYRPPDSTEAQAQLFVFTNTGTPGPGGSQRSRLFRQEGDGSFTEIPLPSTLYLVLRCAVFNGKIFFGAHTEDNHLYCYDPNSGVRTVGVHPPYSTYPTAINIGTGTYPATPRYYKVDFLVKASDGTLLSRSELSAATPPVVPSGTGSAVQVWHGGWGSATHYRVWGSADNVLFYKLSGDLRSPLAFPPGERYDDSTLPANYTGDEPFEVGSFLPPPSALRVMTDGNRLLLARTGVGLGYVPTAIDSPHVPKDNRIWYTPVLGSSDQGDDERIPLTSTQRNFLDLGENTSDGAITEVAGPMDGQIYAFAQRRIWRLVPTGDLATPYLTYSVSDRYGAHLGVHDLFVRAVPGEDEQGNPAIYFSSEYGLYRVGARNIQFVSFDVNSEVRKARNLLGHDLLWLMSYPERKQLWVAVAHDIFVFHWDQGRPDEDGDLRGGWTHWLHADQTNPYGFSPGILHNAVPGGTNVADMRLVPYVPSDGWGHAAYKFERLEAKDGDHPFAAWVTFAPILPTASERQFRVGNAQLIANAVPINLKVTVARDFGTSPEEVRSDEVSLDGTTPRVIRTLEALFSGDVTVFELTVGDVAATPSLWQIDLLRVPVYAQESR